MYIDDYDFIEQMLLLKETKALKLIQKWCCFLEIKYQFKECKNKGGLENSNLAPKQCLKYDYSLNAYYLMFHDKCYFLLVSIPE